MCRENVENLLSGTKASFKATRNLVFNQKAERNTMNRQKSRRILENVLSGTKAGFNNLVFNQKAEKVKMKIIIRSIVENVLSGTKAGFKAILNFEHSIERKKIDHQKSKSNFRATLLALILGLIVLWTGSAAVAAEKKYVTDPSTGKVVSAPEYGGTLTHVLKNTSLVASKLDAWYSHLALFITSGVVEKLAVVDWAIDRDTYHFVGGYMAPLYALRGALAESWEQPDATTYIFHIRQGVHWHDKPPVNGRELTAKDVEHSFHRYLGLGSGFTEPSPMGGALTDLPFESVEATDKWTVVMKLKEPRLDALNLILDKHGMVIQPPEVIEQYGDMQDWRNVVGTGPYTITDLVPATSVTWTKNPTYWGYDEKYPENRLPYIDTVRGLVIMEVPTYLAALRSGKVDYIGWQGLANLNSIGQVESLMRTNPELVVHPWSERSNASFSLNVSKPPFDDIRVRHAMQMALDLETMNDTYFKGYADTIPRGRVGREFKGYHVPFEEWPEELKQYHRYDPAGAEKLLDEAGYPRGADGVRFKTAVMHFQRFDLSWTEFVAAYWRDIGIDVDVETPTSVEFNAREMTGDFEIRGATSGVKADPLSQMGFLWSRAERNAVVRDAEFDALYEAARAAATIEDQMPLIKEMDMRFIEQFWFIWGPLAPSFNVHWPWVMGYNGEGGFGAFQMQVVFSRLWIDSELKEAMGH